MGNLANAISCLFEGGFLHASAATIRNGSEPAPSRPLKVWSAIALTLTAFALFTGCASNETPPAAAEASIQQLQRKLDRIRRSKPETPQRLADYLQIAQVAFRRFAERQPNQPTNNSSLDLYNAAVADFAESWSKQGWPAEVQDERTGRTFRLVSPPGMIHTWRPSYFQTLQNAQRVSQRRFSRLVKRSGVGGALVGVHREATEEVARLEPPKGFRTPVTAVLQFMAGLTSNETIAALQLFDPRDQAAVQLEGRSYPLAADFTAPLATYPRINETVLGFINMIRGQKTARLSGLYLLEPYDPNRVPVVLVHGLASSPFTWLNAGNAIQDDPEIRKRYQFWVFFYPTGNPILVSALRLRQDLALAKQRFGLKRGIILIGHSMGGIICRLQVTNLDRSAWRSLLHEKADALFPLVNSDPQLRSAFLFQANPIVKRVIFISTPHRGSAIASGGLGALGDRIIRLPTALTQRVPKTLLAAAGPDVKKAQIPTSIDGLSPESPLLRLTAQLPIQAPHHSIIGDRGKGDTPNSSDGVVPYWSSHLATAQSELVVPTGHGAMNSPLAIAEIQRILRLNARLNQSAANARWFRQSATN
jgi:pimeloyl-ACP methyl ester carboxylesterase